MKSIILSFILITISNFTIAQQGEVGEWVDYSPYHNIESITEGQGKIYGVSKYGLLEFTKNDNSFLRFSKVEGLSDIGVKCFAYNEVTNSFFVGYANGKIDLITATDIITVTDLFRKTLSGNKSLNNIFMYDKYAFVATGFGIIKFDMERQEFAETYLIEQTGEFIYVNDLTILNDTIYAATVKGVRKAYINDPQITFYKTWASEDALPHSNYSYSIIESLDDRLYLNYSSGQPKSDTLYVRNSNKVWSPIVALYGEKNNGVSAYKNYNLIAHEGFVAAYDYDWNVIHKIFNYGDGKFVNANDAILGKDSVIWIGDAKYGMVKQPSPFHYTIINPEGPSKAKVDGIHIRNNRVWVAAGSRENNWNNVYSNEGVYWRTPELKWGTINKFQDTALKNVFDVIDIISSPNNPNIAYGASLSGGLVEYTDTKSTAIFNASNSALSEAIDLPGWVGVTGLDFDNQGNLWMANTRNPSPLVVYTNEKKWLSYDFGSTFSSDGSGALIVGKNGYKWVVFPSSGKGLLVFDDGGTIEDINDDQYKILNSNVGSGGLPTKDVYSIAEDLDGEIWVGTSEGVGVFYSPNSIFTDGANFDAQQIIVEVNGYFQYLLGTETVTAIAVDGANRKWLGTKNAGVFLMSPDGTKELYHFTTDNSPLISNEIRTIEINSTTGEVLFGTNEGIIAFKSSATGDEVTTSSTYAYPNPVPLNYYGLIAVKGLSANSAVRITDIAGNLVFETIAEGTQAVWNGNDMNGQRVGTGVYLVFGIDTEGKDSQVAKILFTQ